MSKSNTATNLAARHQTSRLRLFRSFYILLLLLPLLFITATLLRRDHLTMAQLRDQIIAADKADDLAAIESGLKQLKSFTASHTIVNFREVNGHTELFFGTGPFYLEQQYIKKASAELKKAEVALKNQQSGTTNIYAAASAVCQPLAIRNGWAWNSDGYIKCMMSEIARHPSAPDLIGSTKASLPSADLYRHNYLSPLWAPTPAGFAMLGCFLLILLLLVRIIWWFILKIALILLRSRKNRK